MRTGHRGASCPRAPRYLALILRGGREEPRAMLLADVDDLEGEDIVGRCLLGRPHHPEGTDPRVTTSPSPRGPPCPWTGLGTQQRPRRDTGKSGWLGGGLEAADRGKHWGRGRQWEAEKGGGSVGVLGTAAREAPRQARSPLTAQDQSPPATSALPAPAIFFKVWIFYFSFLFRDGERGGGGEKEI